MSKNVAPTTRFEWLCLGRSGEKIADFRCEDASVRIQTRTDGGLDFVIVGKDGTGSIMHGKFDVISLVSSIENCIAGHKFAGIHDPVPTTRIRGEVVSSSEDRFVKLTELSALPLNTATLNREKWEREITYIQRMRDVCESATNSCARTLSSFGKRVLRRDA